MNQLQKVFQYQGHRVRTVIKDGEPWFVAKDVCDVLEISNNRMALQRLDDDEKGVSSIDTPGGLQESAIVNEPGLYTLILGSRKPEAKQFKRWVTHEVIPSIRKTGSYSIKKLDSYMIDDPIERAKRWIEEQEEKRKLKTENLVLSQQVHELKPKASYYDLVLQNKSLLSVSKIAKD